MNIREHNHENCHNITCKHMEFDRGYDAAIDEFCSKVITEIIANGIYENGRIIVNSDTLKNNVKSIAQDMKEKNKE